MIKGSEHTIREGSYTTTMKVFLPAGGAENSTTQIGDLAGPKADGADQ
jgi:hypothetical protein